MIRLAPVFALISTFALAGCGVGQAVSDTGSSLFEARQGACPDTGILADANRIVKFYGDGRDLPDVHFRADISDVRSQCDYGRTGGQRYVYTRVRIDFNAQLGTASRPEPVSIPYFVAVIDRATQEILIRETYSIVAPFEGTRTAISQTDSIDRITIPVDTVADGGFYEIIVGFEVTPDELDFNRSREEY